MRERNNQPEYDDMRVCEREIIYQDMLVCLKKENDLCLACIIWIQASVSWFSNSKTFSFIESCKYFFLILAYSIFSPQLNQLHTYNKTFYFHKDNLNKGQKISCPIYLDLISSKKWRYTWEQFNLLLRFFDLAWI